MVNNVRAAILALALALACGLATSSARADVIHSYTRGETFASLAERYYGNARLEPVIVAANFLYMQSTPTLLTGMHLVIPSVSYHRVVAGETWERLGARHLGDGRRGPYLARINGGRFDVSPSPGTVIRLPYLLRYVVNSDEPFFEIARRFFGDRSQVQFLAEFNFMGMQRLQRGQVLIVPLSDVILREQPPGSADAVLVEAHSSQRRVERELPTLHQLLTRGLYVEAVALGARLLAAEDITPAQRVELDRGLAEAYAALDRRDLAADALRDAIRTDPGYTLDGNTTPPKVLDAWGLARGTAPSSIIAPAPPTARPESAH